MLPFSRGRRAAGGVVVRPRADDEVVGLRAPGHLLGRRRRDPDGRGPEPPGEGRRQLRALRAGAGGRVTRHQLRLQHDPRPRRSATWSTTGWWCAASAARSTATCASGSGSHPARARRAVLPRVQPPTTRRGPGRARLPGTRSGRLRRHRRAPVLSNDPASVRAWDLPPGPSGPTPCWAWRCHRACRSWKAAAARGPGQSWSSSSRGRSGSRNGKRRHSWTSATWATNASRVDVGLAGLEVVEELQVAILDVGQVPGSAEQPCSSPRPAAGPDPGEGLDSSPRSRITSCTGGRLVVSGVTQRPERGGAQAQPGEPGAQPMAQLPLGLGDGHAQHQPATVPGVRSRMNP